MQFTLDLDMSSAAFDHYTGRANERDATEVARILRNLADRLNDLNTFSAYGKNEFSTTWDRGTLRDSNGNTVGSWEVTP